MRVPTQVTPRWLYLKLLCLSGNIWLNWNYSSRRAVEMEDIQNWFSVTLCTLWRWAEKGNPGKLFIFVSCIILTALLQYCMLSYCTLISQVCLWWELNQPICVWDGHLWVSEHIWAGLALPGVGTWLSVWEHRVGNEVRVEFRVREGGVQWLPCCTGFCYQ